MKNFWRILSYANPLGTSVIKYAILTLLYVLFSLVNFTVLIPLLEVLFDQVSVVKLEEASNPPDFSITIDYFKNSL